jgi:hypothetical protein
MPIYRINFLDARNSIVDATFADHATDEGVLADASGMRGEHRTIEVWHGQRAVGRLLNTT